MDVLREIQLGIGHLNSRLNSMDERLNSLGVSIEELYDDPTQSWSSEATPNHIPMHNHFILFAFASVYMLLLF